jgi:uncharacterized protein
MVTEKSLAIATRHPELKADKDFIAEAGMLHDIGIFLTHAPGIGCHGEFPYICHGYLGCKILENEGLPTHGFVCERHTGIGLSAEEIIEKELPIPQRDMIPQSIEEQIICFADTFFSKGKDLTKEKTPEEVKAKLQKYGKDKTDKFLTWCNMFL